MAVLTLKKILTALAEEYNNSRFWKKGMCPTVQGITSPAKETAQGKWRADSASNNKTGFGRKPHAGTACIYRPHWKWSDKLRFSVFLGPSCEKLSF